MELSIIIPHIEALIFASEKPLTTLELVELVNNALGFIEDRATLDQLESALEAIREKYQSEFYPFEVRESGGGWQYLTKKEFHKTVAQLNGEKFLKRLSSAALETLSIIAYKQPVTKGEMETIRGVNCDYAVQKLLEKELIIITGRKENAPGQPLLYATSKTFMDYFGINSADDLPKLSDILTNENVEPTVVQLGFDLKEGDSSVQSNPAENETFPLADGNTLVVDADGNLEEAITDSVETTGVYNDNDTNEVVDNKEASNDEDGAIVDETADDAPLIDDNISNDTEATTDGLVADDDTNSNIEDNDDKEKKPD
jgi:segregation and condensation protein B